MHYSNLSVIRTRITLPAIFLVFVTPFVYGQNLFFNPSFENDTTAPFNGAANGALTRESNLEHVRSGSYSLRHEATGNDSYTRPWFGGNRIDYGGVESTFRFSVWAKAQQPNTRVHVYLSCLDENMGASYEVWSQNHAFIGQDWQEITHTITCGPGRRYVGVRFDNDGGAGATVWWDDPVFYQVEDPVFVYRSTMKDILIDDNRRYKEVQVADFNNDGWPDLYVAQRVKDQSDDNIDRVLLHRKHGGSWSNLFFNVEDQPNAFDRLETIRGYDVEVADLDGDGDIDVVRPDSEGRVDILWNDGNGQFTEVSHVVTPALDPNQNAQGQSIGNYDNAAIEDLDYDGDLDIVIAQYGYGENLILRNDGNNQFEFEFDQLPAQNTHSVNIGDLDGDGIPDVALAHASAPPQIFAGSSRSCVTAYDLAHTLDLPSCPPGIPGNCATAVMDMVDLNQDGLLDIYAGRTVFSDPTVLRTQFVFFQDGQGNFERREVPLFMGDPNVYDARYADLDGDATTMEIVRTNILRLPDPDVPQDTFDERFPTLQVIQIGTDKSIRDVTATFFDEFHGEMGVELADLDRDGDLDLILAGSAEEYTDQELGHAALHFYENTTIQLSPGANLHPWAGDDRAWTPTGKWVFISYQDILRNDKDPEGEELTLHFEQITEQGAALSFYSSGFYYTPPLGFSGLDRIFYTATDPSGNSDQAIVTVSVGEIPTPVNDVFSTFRDQPLVITFDQLMANDQGCAPRAIEGYDLITEHGGSNNIANLVAFEYRPAPGFVGLDSFNYTLSSCSGLCKTARVSIIVEPARTFPAIADAYTSQTNPNQNFGSSQDLFMRSTHSNMARHTYFKFRVTGLSGPATSAKLRVKTGPTYFPSARVYHIMDTTWTEPTITWNNAPLGFFFQYGIGYLPANSWQEIDVSSIVSGNGTYTIGLVAADVPNLFIYSKESSNKPSLIVTSDPN